MAKADGASKLLKTIGKGRRIQSIRECHMKSLVIAMALAIGSVSAPAQVGTAKTEWHDIFDGRSLSGWTPKITGHRPGENFANTFIAEDGAIKVNYKEYDLFRKRFGHLFYNKPLRYFKVRMKYRFTGTPLSDTPDWAIANSGVMFLSQPAQSVELDQEFPVSVEFQLLGRHGTGPRPTGSVCTPGTTVYFEGLRPEEHCLISSGPTLPVGQWVDLELDVLPDGQILQRINGKVVMRYNRVELDPQDANARKIIDSQKGFTSLAEGYLALQAEGQSIEFKNIQLQELKP